MNELLKIVLSLSLSGSLLILLLLLCKPLFKNSIGKRWQYYIWLVVIARLLLPFSPETSLVGTLFQELDRSVVAQTEAAPPAGQRTAPVSQPENDAVAGGNFIPRGGEAEKSAPLTPQAIGSIAAQNLWLVWSVVALILLVRKITIYQGFVRYVKAGRAEVSDTAVLDRLALIGEQAGVKKPVELYTNSLISSPLLLGFFRPCIVLPTVDVGNSDFEYIILHELTHYRRRDMFYKWLVQLTVCLHWFNPLVRLMGHEVSRACELACDEAVIRRLDTKRQRDYGDTLLNAIVMGGDYKDSLASMTLNESKELLKERLAAIMEFKNPSVFVRISTAFLTITVILCATFTGAYAATPNQTASAEDTMGAPFTDAYAAIPNRAAQNTMEAGSVVINLSSDGQNSILHSSSFEAKANQTLVLDIKSSISGGTVDFFLFSPSGQEQRITIGGSDKTETIALTAGRWAYNCTGFFERGAVTIDGKIYMQDKNTSETDGTEETVSHWTESEFVSFMQEQEKAYKKLLASGDMTRTEYNVYIAADKAILEQIQKGHRISKSATGSIEHGQSADYWESTWSSVWEPTWEAAWGDGDNEKIRTATVEGVYDRIAENVAEEIRVKVREAIRDAYKQYEPYGLSYDIPSGRLYHNNRLVRFFEDETMGRDFGAYEDGDVDVRVVRDSTGAPVKLEVTEVQPQK